MSDGPLFWAYANLAFEAVVVFILPLAFAARELVLLRRDGRKAAGKRGALREAALAVEADDALAAGMGDESEAPGQKVRAALSPRRLVH